MLLAMSKQRLEEQMKEQFNQPSDETKKKILKFLLETSVPRILAEKQSEAKEE